ncbi:Uncharacterised protein [[Clostridium] sordellii]|uniref:hypothetical protein n=2 Tax=Paraclostridium sordellii TaxID=1505 RepID=UPI0005E601F3|nr:hypothetical protein [Paeniclostridium sordellii]MBX9182899.1 hypothetical protein [Paeniclostridium sordellii]MDU1455702.1 hypothetical protein [Paeniclostridium sordellii]CEO12306.1 Uncharacterised protein [[Clostridium] sordellii] [Paeniclostridium sordellii]CEP85818.1 Uncharacterised protein [[Clostridium] sordellii] [Paeniclostridium sordellii]CEQ19365.1 Uncharacterised protein [[Clostridium] sordellii] [Paeniclostridium sordellii]
MKKNKTVAYALAATLLVGGTFLGTKALFTDSIENVGEISISTGDLDIEADDTNWVLDRNGTEHGDGTNNVEDPEGNGESMDKNMSNDITRTKSFANNLKPGDKLIKKVMVTNKGTLAVGNLSVTKNEGNIDLGPLAGLITVSEGKLGKTSLIPGESTELQLEIVVKNQGGQHNKEGYNTDDIENATIRLKNAWTLNATQQNPDEIK